MTFSTSESNCSCLKAIRILTDIPHLWTAEKYFK
jgi:hypothetical protein